MSGHATALELRALAKQFSGHLAVREVNLTVAPGEMIALLGPSGCGKTTTLRMIAGFLEPDTGAVVIDGTDVTAFGPERRPSAMVFQNYALWPHLTVFKNVAFPLVLRRLPRAEVRERVMAALETVNLAHHASSRPAHISGGEQQRAALARAIVQEPELLLLDEPLSNLDAKLRVKVREEIRDIQQRLGITTVMVTHDQDEALAISDRVAVMNGGRIEQVSKPADLYSHPRTEFVASFIGSMNFLAGPDLVAALAAGPSASSAAAVVAPAAASSASPSVSPEPGAGPRERWAVRPEDVHFIPESATATAAPGGPRTPCEVRRVLPHGHFAELVLDLDGLELRSITASRDGRLPTAGERGSVALGPVRHYRDGLLVERAAGAAE